MSYLQIIFMVYIYINFSTIYISAQHQFNESNGSLYTLPAYVIASRAGLLNSTCGKELHHFKDAIDTRILWSLKSKIFNIVQV